MDRFESQRHIWQVIENLRMEEQFLIEYCAEDVFLHQTNSRDRLVTFHTASEVSGTKGDTRIWFYVLAEINRDRDPLQSHLELEELCHLNQYSMTKVPPVEWPLYLGSYVSPWFEAMIKAGEYVPKPPQHPSDSLMIRLNGQYVVESIRHKMIHGVPT